MDLFSLTQGPLAGCCNRTNEPWSTLEGREFWTSCMTWQFLKNDCAMELVEHKVCLTNIMKPQGVTTQDM